ncbi:MAG: hypothetical protein ACOYLS_08260 [Polymorphobacter sp.]
MTLLLTAFIMIAFAAVYALLLAMLGSRAGPVTAALLGQPVRFQGTATASRRFSRA